MIINSLKGPGTGDVIMENNQSDHLLVRLIAVAE
jgi:hypothetical protein